MKSDKDNVFLSHIEKDGWNELHAYHIEKEVAWRNIAIIAIVALAIVSIVSMYLVNQDKHKTLVFERNSLGNMTLLGIADKTFNIDNKMVAHQLANFIIAFREVSHDLTIRRRNIDLVHKMIDSKIQQAIDKKILEQYKKAGNGEILVDIKSVKPLPGGKSWVVNWIEHLDSQTDSNWSTTVSFERLDNININIQLVNPIGLFITYINPIEDIDEN
ncbi:MAG: type IV secretion system protein [Neisseriaceae bacterium]